MKKRVSWDQYFMQITESVATRSTCDRANVGAIIVKNNYILGHGYNGAPKGVLHCDDIGHTLHNNHCIGVIHAEVNAIIQATSIYDIEGATLYCTHTPCMDCCKIILNVGIKKVIYKYLYLDDKRRSFGVESQSQYLIKHGIKVFHQANSDEFSLIEE
jgi:dCMP deaminase